ncbi:MAG: cobyric acid synthase [Tissierellia bacterium]|nr:cobyric acid synthase [Tissierellia bacterium]
MAKIMVLGTTSSSGKTTLVTALCRAYKNRGINTAPFKSQNMSSNAFNTPAGLIMSNAQAIQAKASKIEPTTDMNPILLIPSSDMGSDVILNGKSIGHMRAAKYFKYKKELKPKIMESFNKLEKAYDLVIIEGAGSPAEINLRENDIVNMGLAQMVDAPCILVGDIDRGGLFAQLYGTVKLLEKAEQKRIKGMIINKFRGDLNLLKPGIKMIEEKLGIPVLGVIPYTKIELADEDSIIDYKKDCNINEQTEIERDKEIEKLAKIAEENLDLDLIFRMAK